MERNEKFIIGLSLFILGGALIGFYAYNQSKEYLGGPVVVISEPQDGATFTEGSVLISGNAQNVSHITLDDATIFVDSKGDFRQKLLLLPGYNILTISAKDRFGRKTEKTLELIYKEPAKEIIATSSPSSTL